MKNNKKIIITAAVLVIIILAAAVFYPKLAARNSAANAEPTGEESKGETAPDFEVFDPAGEAVKLSEQVGKPVVVNFWATWCGYCVMEFPAFEKCASEYGDEVVFMMVDLTDGRRDTVEGATAFIEEKGYTFPLYFDTQFSAVEAYGVNGIPMTVFVKSDGSVLYEHVGAMDEGTLRGYIDKLTGGVEK